MKLSVDQCRNLVDYDCNTGIIIWKERGLEYFQSEKRSPEWLSRAWNAAYAGKVAFTAKSHGYFIGCILKKMVKSHRLAWAVHYGEWPDGEIDHINGDRADNRISNLRCVTSHVNRKNEGASKNNTSGYSGVQWCKQTNKWRAVIKHNYKNVHIGRYVRKEDAISAVKRKRSELGFHYLHGERDSFRD